MTFIAKHLSVSIERSAAEVYEFASNPENLPQWAGGLSGSIKKVDGEWIAEVPFLAHSTKKAFSREVGINR